MVPGMTTNKAEAARLLVDWWGECRTCRFWSGEIARAAPCTNERSPNHGYPVESDGYCPQWDPKNLDVALRVLELDYEGRPGDEIIAVIAWEP